MLELLLGGILAGAAVAYVLRPIFRPGPGPGQRACPGCGARAAAEAAYCAQCGRSLGGPLERCDSCGAPVEADARFCARCGAGVAP